MHIFNKQLEQDYILYKYINTGAAMYSISINHNYMKTLYLK